MEAASRLLWLVLLLVVGCGGAPFESSSLTGSPLAGAPSSAGAQSAGESAGPSGGAGGVAGGNAAGNAAGGSIQEIPNASGGAGGAELGGAGVDSGGAPTIRLACNTSAWKASAFASGEAPALAIDGDASTRWTSGTAREPGQWFALELGAGVVLERLEIRALATPSDVPSSLELELDGKPVDALLSSPERGLLVLSFPSTPASSARLVLTSSAATWWSIAEIAGVCQ